MKVVVGSKNPVKIGAAREVLSRFFTESVGGAIARAERALAHGDLGVGIESGLVEVLHIRTGYLDVHFCAITDGIATTIGTGSGFEYPPAVVEEVKKGRTIEDVMGEITGIKDIGRKEGAVGFLSNGRLTRVELAKQAVLSAMIPRMWMEDG